jgi:predicted nicotinamide N-methyase
VADLLEEAVRVGGTELSLLRPAAPDALIDEEAFARDEFLPYWAELWPAARALAEALPRRLDGVRVVELGCGLGIPALVAAARGAAVTATDWAEDAVALLRVNAERNGLRLHVRVYDWRQPWPRPGRRFDLALTSDVLYERRNVEPLIARLAELAPTAVVGLAGRPFEDEFLRRVERVQQLVVVRTGPGQAQTLASALDRAQLPEVIGTIGGDDTILVIARGSRGAAALARRLKDYTSE